MKRGREVFKDNERNFSSERKEMWKFVTICNNPYIYTWTRQISGYLTRKACSQSRKALGFRDLYNALKN
jgi:hypothetical protein